MAADTSTAMEEADRVLVVMVDRDTTTAAMDLTKVVDAVGVPMEAVVVAGMARVGVMAIGFNQKPKTLTLIIHLLLDRSMGR